MGWTPLGRCPSSGRRWPFAGNEFAGYDASLGSARSQAQPRAESCAARHHSGCLPPAHSPKNSRHKLKGSAIRLPGKPSGELSNSLAHGAASCSSLTGTGEPGSRSPCISRKVDRVTCLGTLSGESLLDRTNDSPSSFKSR